MSEHRPAPDAPAGAVDAIIDRLLETLSSPPDTEALNEARAEFRRRVPLHLRSYAAAALILEAAAEGGQRQRGGRRQDDSRRGREGGRGSAQDSRQSARQGSGTRDTERAERPERAAAQEGSRHSEEPRPRYQGEGITVFFGMGKRQRLYPRVLLRILTEEGGLSLEEIGDIRSFDNYSFADIAPDKAEAIIASLNGVEFRGRGIPVSRARKRGEAAPEESSPAGSGTASSGTAAEPEEMEAGAENAGGAGIPGETDAYSDSPGDESLDSTIPDGSAADNGAAGDESPDGDAADGDDSPDREAGGPAQN